MKKYALIIAAICACLISCTKETPKFQEETASPAMKTVTITATTDEALTKTSYAGGTSFSWTAGDQISVYCSDGNFYPFTADETGATSTFTGSIPDGVSLGNRAFFPADDSHDLANYFYHIPETKDMTGHPSADIPMIGDKGEDDSYTFAHCCGATKLTITNIPANIVSVQISIASPSLKLSGDFGVFTDAGYWRWNPKAASTDSEKNFSRKVAVADHEASIYIPYASGSEWWGKNVVNVTGFDASNASTALVTNKEMSKSIGVVARACVLPLKPLVLSNLNNVDWTASDVATSTLDPSNSKKCLTDLKVASDAYYMYARVKGPVEGFAGNYLDIYLSDGNGSNYALSNDNVYWNTGGNTVYINEHKGTITSSSLVMTFNGVNIETNTETIDGDIYWYMAFPRSAHELLSSSGTVYVAFMLWNNWSCVGAIPTRYTYMLPVTLP